MVPRIVSQPLTDFLYGPGAGSKHRDKLGVGGGLAHLQPVLATSIIRSKMSQSLLASVKMASNEQP